MASTDSEILWLLYQPRSQAFLPLVSDCWQLLCKSTGGGESLGMMCYIAVNS